MGKYDRLREHLETVEPGIGDCTLTFDRLEEILGSPLPPSARQYRPWWANESGPSRHPQARGWLDAGWAVDIVDLQARWVRFVRTAAPTSGRPERQPRTIPRTGTSGRVALHSAVSPKTDPPATAKGSAGRTIALVSCVSQKGTRPAPGRDLYISSWFLKARAFAERNANAWYILSAKYGLVAPDQVISPYNVTLKELPAAERRAWASRVAADLRYLLKAGDHVLFLAGETYRAGLLEAIRAIGCIVEVPMEGLAIGEQLKWLNEHLQ